MKRPLFLVLIFFMSGLNTSTCLCMKNLTDLITALTPKIFKKKQPKTLVQQTESPVSQSSSSRPSNSSSPSNSITPSSPSDSEFSNRGTLRRVSTVSDGSMKISFRSSKLDKYKEQISFGDSLSKEEQEDLDKKLEKLIYQINQKVKK